MAVTRDRPKAWARLGPPSRLVLPWSTSRLRIRDVEDHTRPNRLSTDVLHRRERPDIRWTARCWTGRGGAGVGILGPVHRGEQGGDLVNHLPDVHVDHEVVLARQDTHHRLVLRVVGERRGWLGHQVLDSSLSTNHGVVVDHPEFE